MRFVARLALFLALLATCRAALSGEYNPTLDIGDAAPAWKDLPGVDGKRHSLADLKDREFVVVAFTCNSCPYAVDYEERLIAFTKKHEGKVAVVAINVNKVPEDSPQAMKERAEAQGFNFPYLYDETQEIARKYGATRTPEFFLLDKDRKVAYMGAMDDNSDASKAKAHYLEQAIADLRAGRAVKVAETLPVGCAVRYVRQRRTSR